MNGHNMEIMMRAALPFNLLTSMTKLAYSGLSNNHQGKKTSTATVTLTGPSMASRVRRSAGNTRRLCLLMGRTKLPCGTESHMQLVGKVNSGEADGGTNVNTSRGHVSPYSRAAVS